MSKALQRALGLAVAGLLVLGGCSGKGPNTQEPSVNPQVPVSTKNARGEGKFEGAVADVSDRKCVKDGNQWVATGKVTNPTKAAAGYRIFVAWLDAENKNRGYVQVNVDDVAAGESKPFEAKIAALGDDLKCNLQVERRPAASK